MQLLEELHDLYPIFKWMNNNLSLWSFMEREHLDAVAPQQNKYASNTRHVSRRLQFRSSTMPILRLQREDTVTDDEACTDTKKAEEEVCSKETPARCGRNGLCFVVLDSEEQSSWSNDRRSNGGGQRHCFVAFASHPIYPGVPFGRALFNRRTFF